MKTNLPKIGNDVSNDLVEDTLEISEPKSEHPRSGWAEAFSRALSQDQEQEMLIDDTFPNKFDEDEWVW